MSEPNDASASAAAQSTPSTSQDPQNTTSSSSSSSSSSTQPQPQAPSDTKPKHKPFPTVTGGCICSTIRYRLLSSPLFCYACHCPDCQRSTGSAFGLFLNIESSNIRILSPTRPVPVVITRRPGLVSRHVECPKCKCELWSSNMLGPAISDVRVGTLDYPSLMEPDVHSFTESRLEWVRLPEGATATVRGFEHRKLWPEASLRRLDAAVEKWARNAAVLAAAVAAKSGEVKGGEGAAAGGGEDGAGGDGEKTPTAGEFGAEGEDDEAFERRFRETERALQERLEKLSKKLAEEDGKRRLSHLEDMTANLQIDGEKEEDAKTKDGIVAPPVD